MSRISGLGVVSALGVGLGFKVFGRSRVSGRSVRTRISGWISLACPPKPSEPRSR